MPRGRRVDAEVRVSHLIGCLDELVHRWEPAAVACCQPSGINWSMPSLECLDAALVDWSRRHRLCFYAYTTQEVRATIAGHSHASRDQLGYAVMTQLGLIGQGKTTHEWEAIAVGYHHLTR